MVHVFALPEGDRLKIDEKLCTDDKKNGTIKVIYHVRSKYIEGGNDWRCGACGFVTATMEYEQ